MKQIFSLFFILSLLSLCLPAQAELQYHDRWPFTLTIGTSDVLVIRYNFSGKGGIYCEANSPQVKIEFAYKGREKSADLPVTLQANLPQNPHQELADITGNLHLFASDLAESQKEVTVTCHYLDVAISPKKP